MCCFLEEVANKLLSEPGSGFLEELFSGSASVMNAFDNEQQKTLL